MWILKSGFCGCSLRNSVLIVFYSNAICYMINYFFYLGIIADLENNGFPLYMIISKLTWDVQTILVSFVPIGSTLEKALFWLKAFIFIKAFEVVGTVFYMLEMIHLDIINKIRDVLIDERLSQIHFNSIQHAQIRGLFDDVTNVVKFFTYTYMVLWMIVFAVYFPFVVYSYLKEIKRKDATNAHHLYLVET